MKIDHLIHDGLANKLGSMSSQTKSDFSKLCRELRIEHGLKQRQVAAILGIATSTAGNLESSPFKVIRRDRAVRLADHYRLVGARREAFLDAWDHCPVNPASEQLKKKWQRLHAQRDKIRLFDHMHLVFVEFLGAALPFMPKPVCYCEFGGGTAADPTRNCDICNALEIVGIADGWTNELQVLRRLGKIQDALTEKLTKTGVLNGKPA